MKLCLISDTHNFLPDLPEADMLIHAGDLTLSGTVNECRKTLGWLNAQPHKHIVFIAGNHDFAFENSTKKIFALEGFDRLTYLENSGTEIEGLKIYGSPVQPWFHDWAFNAQRGAPIRKVWDKVPNGLDILVTHGPPHGCLDQAITDKTDHLGCEELAIRIDCAAPKIHVFGHIHGSYGDEEKDGTRYYNASLVNEAYKLVNVPIVTEI